MHHSVADEAVIFNRVVALQRLQWGYFGCWTERWHTGATAAMFSRPPVFSHVHIDSRVWLMHLYMLDRSKWITLLPQLFSFFPLASWWIRRSRVDNCSFFPWLCERRIINHAAVAATCLTSDLHIFTQSFPALHQSCFYETLCTETWISWKCTSTSWRCCSSKSPVSLSHHQLALLSKILFGLLFLLSVSNTLSFRLLTLLFRLPI